MSEKVKVKILVPIGGNADEKYDQAEFSYQPGTEVELHPKLAKAWIASGTAEAVEEEKDEETEDNGEENEEEEPETTSVEASETTSLPRPRRKKGKK